MDEKILIKSTMNKKAKAILSAIPAMFFIISSAIYIKLLSTKATASGWNALEAGLRNSSKYSEHLTLFTNERCIK